MPDRATLERLFEFDLAAGRIFWKIPPPNHPRLRGKEAGGAQSNRDRKIYWVVRSGREAWKRGRLIFFMAQDRWPSPCVDHIDGDSLNDCASNLREATITENAWNHRTRKRRIPLPMGVRIVTSSGRYEARIAHNKKMIHLGAFDTPAAAQAVYLAKRKELYGEFSGT